MFRTLIVAAFSLSLVATPVCAASDLSPEELTQLNALLAKRSQKVLEGIPMKPNHRGYIGEFKGPQVVKAGCEEHKVEDPKTNHTFVRVICK